MNRYVVNKVQELGYTLFELVDTHENGSAMITPDFGANLLSYSYKEIPIIVPPNSLQVFIEQTSAHTMYGTPILFPPNRILEGTFTFGGRHYRLPLNEPPHHHLHGEMSHKAWKVVDVGASDEKGAYVSCQFDFAEHPEIMAYFPHPLLFTVRHNVFDGHLKTQLTVENKGGEVAPFALGLHPYFATPPAGEGCYLTVPAAEEWPVTNLAFVKGYPGDTAFCERLSQGIPLDTYPKLGCSLLTLNGDRTCRFDMKEAGYRIAYQIDPKFPFVVLFKPDWTDAFSIEPYTYVTDAFNLPYPPELTGARGIEAQEVIQLSTEIWLEKI
ncbi:aldose 1-epimerase [Paenibacillus qinlingensis]|uniref:aldose 1-epimerase n=1 Tax=Paenibacillus qinlingensis TaxID=1837343 RepID=UPI0015647607|nr:aldose 1-epimerase [Paenibacillus qinlingensis]NQX58432.1 aldose 1-epimerase [Paenibacillus qinlingensis]